MAVPGSNKIGSPVICRQSWRMRCHWSTRHVGQQTPAARTDQSAPPGGLRLGSPSAPETRRVTSTVPAPVRGPRGARRRADEALRLRGGRQVRAHRSPTATHPDHLARGLRRRAPPNSPRPGRWSARGGCPAAPRTGDCGTRRTPPNSTPSSRRCRSGRGWTSPSTPCPITRSNRDREPESLPGCPERHIGIHPAAFAVPGDRAVHAWSPGTDLKGSGSVLRRCRVGLPCHWDGLRCRSGSAWTA